MQRGTPNTAVISFEWVFVVESARVYVADWEAIGYSHRRTNPRYLNSESLRAWWDEFHIVMCGTSYRSKLDGKASNAVMVFEI